MTSIEEKIKTTNNKKTTEIEHQIKQSMLRKSENAAWFSIMIVMLLIGLFSLYYASTLDPNEYKSYELMRPGFFQLSGFISIIAAAGTLSYLYMSGSIRPDKVILDPHNGGAESISLDTLIALASSIEKSANKISENKAISTGDLKRIEEKFLKSVSEYLPSELLGQIKDQYGKEMLNESVIELTKQQSNSSISRLKNLRESFSSKSATSLVWGLVISTAGLGVLAYFISTAVDVIFENKSNVEIAFYFLSRLSFVALVEVIGVFFFRQYRLSLSDELYVSNEITNLEMRLTSLQASVTLNNHEAINKVLIELAKTERNFILKKDERSALNQVQNLPDVPQGMVDQLIKALQSVTPAGK